MSTFNGEDIVNETWGWAKTIIFSDYGRDLMEK